MKNSTGKIKQKYYLFLVKKLCRLVSFLLLINSLNCFRVKFVLSHISFTLYPLITNLLISTNLNVGIKYCNVKPVFDLNLLCKVDLLIARCLAISLTLISKWWYLIIRITLNKKVSISFSVISIVKVLKLFGYGSVYCKIITFKIIFFRSIRHGYIIYWKLIIFLYIFKDYNCSKK